jgi:transmembrane sensor
MEFQNFNTNDFLENASFRRWVRKPDAELDAFWRDFLEKHPEKKPEVIAATNFLLGIEQHVEKGASADQHEEAVFRRIRGTINYQDTNPPVLKLTNWTAWAAAASILLLLGYFFFSGPITQTDTISYETNLSQSESALIERTNDTSLPIPIALADGSTLTLQPRSRVSFAKDFGIGTKRIVYLSGEAFFDVARDTEKPFFVYANELVTKVLGTSFTVRAYQDDESVNVKVRTGRVSVSVNDQINKQETISIREREGILLLPNQQAVLSRREIRLVKSLVEHPVLLSETAPDLPHYSFVFKAEPVSEVLAVLEKAYGLDIVYDEKVFADCKFTSDLNGVPPYEKLDIICQSIEASYRILDAQIIISGKGCQP